MASPASVTINDPLWGTHVPVVLGERPRNLASWGDRNGLEIKLDYEQRPTETDRYVYLPVNCTAALDYREQLGLPREPRYPLHLTIGNRKPARGIAVPADGNQSL